MNNATQDTIQTRFARRCQELLDIMVDQTAKEETWDLYLAKGAGDRAIAGDHEERHLLELLQNARDAIYRGQEEDKGTRGRVLIAVTEHGMAIANTGAPFRLHDEDVLKAVRFLQRSDKLGRGFIGHKGVGLKSILLRAGAFAVRSRINGEILRATFSRSRTAEHLLAYLDENADTLLDGQGCYVRQQLPRLPLFTQPHVDTAHGENLGADTWLVETLLSTANKHQMGLDSAGRLTALPAFTTVVYLPYWDELWETLLEDTKAALSADDRAAFEQARRQSELGSGHTNGEDLWQELENLDRRVLVLLGEIAELQFARFAGGTLQEIRRIDIGDPLSPLNGARASESRRLAIREQGWSRESGLADLRERSFFVLSAPTNLGVLEEETSPEEEPREHIRVLLEIPKVDRPRLRDEPLFLYYPIETAHSGLPFIIHGPFRVNSSRTALIKSQKAHNRKVLQAAVQLLETQIPRLVEESSEIRAWLPWILLPVVDPEADGRSPRSDLQQDLDKQMIALLRANPTVPTPSEPSRPEEVHFFPERPEALLVFAGVEKTSPNQERALRLLAADNHKAYRKLYEANDHVLSQAAQRIGLGQVDLRRFAQALAVHFSGSRGNMPVDEAEAEAFFLNLCVLFGEAHDEEAQAAAEIIGEHRIPILPAFRENAVSETKQLLLVPTERRDLTRSEKLQKASRVVFWRPSSGESRVDGMPAPPETIPVYFMSPAVIKAEGARAEGILSQFYNEWGTTRFESRPDLFRRVADRAQELPGETVLPVLGYLSRLLYRITSKSFTGAEDLQPRPYAAIDLATLRKAVHRYGSSRVPYWEQLESLQRWAQIQVPVQGSQRFMPAESAVFGPAWAAVLQEFVRQVEPAKPEDDDLFFREREWAEAIDKLAMFRERIGRDADDGCYPEIAPPHDERWEEARQHLRREGSLDSQIEETKALFDLLLLLGVRVGPRVVWRWFSTRMRTDKLRSLNCEASRALFAGEGPGLPEDLKPLSQAPLTRAYCDYILMKPYHTFFFGGHSRGCREDLKRQGDGGSAVAAWIWFPDLMEVQPFSDPFEHHDQVDAFREVIVSLWSSLSKAVLYTGWYCCRGWHKGRQWEHAIPSLAAFQLSQLNLWLSRDETHLPDAARHRFSAAVMIAWDKKEPPSSNEAERFFPLLDVQTDIWQDIARILQIEKLSELSLHGAVSRLRWLLEQSRVEGQAPDNCWPISEFGEVTRNTWLRAQYRLLARIVEEDPLDPWSQRALRIGDLALRAVRDEHQIAVPVIAGSDGTLHFPNTLNLAFFSQSPRYWEREEHADKWIVTSVSQLQSRLYRWAEMLGAERISQSKPPAYTGRSVNDDPEALRALRQEVRRRLPLLLGVFKAHQAENLDEMAKRVLGAMDKLQAVVPDKPDKMGSSGLNEGNIVFSYPAYEEYKGTGKDSQAVVLAEGIALLVNQTTAVGDLQNALGAPRHQVEHALHFRGIDLAKIVKGVSSLAHERLASLTEQIDDLLQVLSQVDGNSSFVKPQWKTGKGGSRDWLAQVEALEALEGSVAKQALQALQSTVSGLAMQTRRQLLRTTVDDGLKASERIRDYLTILEKAGWPLEKRRAFATSEPFSEYLGLKDRQEFIAPVLAVATTVTLIEGVCSGELEIAEDMLNTLADRAVGIRSRLILEPTDSGFDFLRHLEDELKLAMSCAPSERLLIEWEEDAWRELAGALREIGGEALPALPTDVRDVLGRCLNQGSLAPLKEDSRRALSARQRRLQRLERRLDQEPAFDFDLNVQDGVPEIRSEAVATSRPGGSGGISAGVTEDQVVRGRVAELFVLHACWQRFVEQNAATRERILEAIAEYREQGSGEDSDHVRWSTKTAWRTLQQRLASCREPLLAASAEDDQLARLFRDLIEVANERGPGYDVLDPFGVWGGPSAAAIPKPRRVEIKAVLDDPGASSAYRIMLSTNEYHRASCDQASYVLRLIAVPRNPEQHLAHVRWVCDIPNPVQRLRLPERISRGVRGGTLPLELKLST